MPKDLFYIISEEKREKVVEAAMEEFSEKLFHEASINQIIKRADISRGSFYQYFEDKEDLYFYIIDTILHEKTKEFAGKVDFINMDIFTIYRNMFILNLSMISDSEYQKFFMNFYLSMNYNFEIRFKNLLDKLRDDIFKGELSQLLIKYEDRKQEFLELNKILNIIGMNLRMMKISSNISDEEILKLYDIRIQIISGKIRFDE